MRAVRWKPNKAVICRSIYITAPALRQGRQVTASSGLLPRVQTSAVTAKQLQWEHIHMPADPTPVCLEKAIKAKALSDRLATSPFEWGCPAHPQIPISTQVPYTPYLPSKWWNQVFKQWHASQVFNRKRILARERQKSAGKRQRSTTFVWVSPNERNPFTSVCHNQNKVEARWWQWQFAWTRLVQMYRSIEDKVLPLGRQ